jgi:hypothetical protein
MPCLREYHRTRDRDIATGTVAMFEAMKPRQMAGLGRPVDERHPATFLRFSPPSKHLETATPARCSERFTPRKYRGLLIVATQKTKSAIAVLSLFLLLHNNYWASEKVCISLSLLFLSKSSSSHVEGSGTWEVDPKDHADESEPRMASSRVQTDSLPIVLGTEDLLPMPLPLPGPERVNQTIVPGFPAPFWISVPRLHARCKCPAL